MEEKKQEKTKKKIVFYLIPILIFVIFIGYMMVQTFTGEVKTSVMGTTLSVESFEDLSDSFEEVLQENMYGKNEYINLNGLTTRVLGINTLNERYKLANGYLARSESKKNTEEPTTAVIELNEFLNDREIPFLYILAPTKTSFYDAEFAPGYSSEAWQNIDVVIDTLNAAGVNNLDMNAWFKENDWTMEDVFFITDHHWLPQAQFQTTKLYMEYLSQQGLAKYDPETLDEENWTITIYDDWFLGSDGKRTGATFAGTDDFALYVPNFETNYSYMYLKTGTTDWIYTDSPLFLSYLKEKDYFNDSVNYVYLGNNYPLRKTINTEAYNEGKILVIGDSYRRAFEYFLSTQFQEVYGVDLRYYSDGTLAQFIAEIQPDLVVMCTYEDSLKTKSLYRFGTSSYLSAFLETDAADEPIMFGDFSAEATEDQNDNFTVVCSNLEPNQTYTLTLDSTEYSGGKDQFIQMTIQDISSNKAIVNRYFDVNTNEIQKWIFTTPDDLNANYSIYLYTGTKGHTENVSVKVTNVILHKGVFED